MDRGCDANLGGLPGKASIRWTDENIALLGHAAAVAATILVLIMAIWATKYVVSAAAQDFGAAVCYPKAS
jgi:hypothetical protein